jgi:hypothetical protein
MAIPGETDPMIYKIIKVAVVLLLLFYGIKVIAIRASATRQDAIALLLVFAVGFAISLSEAIKLRNKRKRELGNRPEYPKE